MPRTPSLTARRRKRNKRTAAAAVAKGVRGTQTFPPKSYLDEQAAKLTTFPPHRLEDIIGGPLRDTTGQITAKVIEEIRRLTRDQLDQLVGELGVDTQHPDKWQRAFQELAAVHHGVGLISWRPSRPPNRNAAKQTEELDFLLYEYVGALMAEGKSEKQSLRLIAKDPIKCERLKLSSKSTSQTPDAVMKFETLQKRYRRIAKMAPPGSWLAALTGSYPIYGSEKDRARHTRILMATMPDFIPSGKSRPSKKP